MLKITTPTQKICLGASEITLDLEATNVSQKTIIIDKKNLWSGSVSSSFQKGKIIDRWLSGGSITTPYKGDYIKLAPKETYCESHKFSFAAENNKIDDYFHRVGKYTLTVTYRAFQYFGDDAETEKLFYIGAANSNEVEFRIAECSKK